MSNTSIHPPTPVTDWNGSSSLWLMKYGIMAGIIWASGLATAFTREPQILIIAFAIATVYLASNRQLFYLPYIASIAFWLTYIGLAHLKYPGDNLFWPFLYVTKLTIAFAIIQYYKAKIARIYCDCIFALSALSLLLYGFQIAAPDVMIPIWAANDLSGGLFEKPHLHYYHAFGYTVHQFIDTSKGFPRNAGFAWEPGAFAAFVVIAWVLHLHDDTGSNKQKRLRTFVFLLTLLSTQSSTGLIAALVIFVLIALQQIRSARSTIILIFIALLTIVFGGAHLQKLDEQLEQSVYSNIHQLQALEGEFGLNRLQSLEILLQDFYANPILGIGADREAAWLSQLGLQLSATSGWGNFLATYGLFLTLPYLFFLARSSRVLCHCNHTPSLPLGLFWTTVIIGFSFSVLETPIVLAFSLYSLYTANST